MRAVDTNVLVYAFFSDSPFHDAATRAVQGLAESPVPWAIPWPCIHEFYGVVTNPKIFDTPKLPARARSQINEWLRSPSLQLLAETPQHWSLLQELLSGGGVAGPAVHDARIAALCLTHGVTELLTQDRDFSKFPKLKLLSLMN
ncbi:MAG: PIN domain-containing protein [Cryobacterium sp.]|nr:PIN domain-containing protein [Cryobacterium sp.]